MQRAQGARTLQAGFLKRQNPDASSQGEAKFKVRWVELVVQGDGRGGGTSTWLRIMKKKSAAEPLVTYALRARLL